MASFRASAAYRIVIVYAAVFAWAILLIGAIVYFAVNNELLRQRDGDIAGEIDRLSRMTDHARLVHEVSWRPADRDGSAFQYVLFDREGRRIAGGLDIALPGTGLADIAAPPGHATDDMLRIVARDLADGSRLAVAAGSREIDRINGLILKGIAAIFFASLVINALSALVLRWYLYRRLAPISATANAIVTGDIEWRVPVRGRGDEFDAVGDALNLMLDRIAGLMENLRQVSSDIAHDLRKPLIRLLLQTDRLGESEDAQQRVLELGDEMLMLFKAILRIAEVEGGGLERNFTRVDFSGLMDEVAEIFEPAITDDGHVIDWTIAPDIGVMGNRELLAQLATNLLDNARIHTPAGTRIRLALFAEGSNAKLVVEDNGPGVADEDRDKLLQRFFRTEDSRTTPGNGLGLSLVAAVVRAMRGSVAVENADPGLRVVVTLPASDA